MKQLKKKYPANFFRFSMELLDDSCSFLAARRTKITQSKTLKFRNSYIFETYPLTNLNESETNISSNIQMFSSVSDVAISGLQSRLIAILSDLEGTLVTIITKHKVRLMSHNFKSKI